MSTTKWEDKMLVFFRLIDKATPLSSKPVHATMRDLGHLKGLLHANGVIADPDDGQHEHSAKSFEINANGIALAPFDTRFPGRDDLLCIVEEAQFLARMIRIDEAEDGSGATLSVSEHIAMTPDMAVTEIEASRIIRCLGITERRTQTISLDQLRTALEDPVIYDRFETNNLEAYYAYLTRIAGLEYGDQTPTMTWS